MTSFTRGLSTSVGQRNDLIDASRTVGLVGLIVSRCHSGHTTAAVRQTPLRKAMSVTAGLCHGALWPWLQFPVTKHYVYGNSFLSWGAIFAILVPCQCLWEQSLSWSTLFPIREHCLCGTSSLPWGTMSVTPTHCQGALFSVEECYHRDSRSLPLHWADLSSYVTHKNRKG